MRWVRFCKSILSKNQKTFILSYLKILVEKKQFPILMMLRSIAFVVTR